MLEYKIETPALIIDLDTMEANLDRMQAYAQRAGLALRPHYKTHKSTVIAHMQIQRGAKGICCAKVGEAADLVLAGVEDVLIANQITDQAKIAKVAALAGCCYLTVCVDDAANISDLSAAATLQGSTIHCLVELDIGQNRCGVRSFQEFYELAKKVQQSPGLVFEGIEAYAGHLAHVEDDSIRKAKSDVIEAQLKDLKAFLEDKGLPVKEVSGVSTGTAFFHGEDSVYTEIQPGSYPFVDTAYNPLNLGFNNALYVLASVIGVRDGKVITDAGLKSVGTDQKPPQYLDYPDSEVSMSEEHSTIFTQTPRHRIGDRLRMIPGHCCTTVNLHDHYYFIRNGRVMDRVPVTSRGKSC